MPFNYSHTQRERTFLMNSSMGYMAFLSPLALLTFVNLALFHGSAELVYEDGYTVTTVLDGDKVKINPHSLSSRPGFSDLVLLDSSNSRFYTLSLPLSQESVIKEFAGNGKAGSSDGDASAATFNKPKSFAVDLKGNVYVADKSNFAVRKISKSGIVTTIAGGNSKTATGGHADGPGRDATFSADFEITFAPDMCALLIVDHGHRLVRQINLKQENCVHSESGMRATIVWPWVAAIVVSCLAGLLIGFTIRPYISRHEGLNFLQISKSWTCYLMNLGRQTRMLYFGTRNAVANPSLKFLKSFVMLFLSHLSLLIAFLFKRVDSSTTSVNNCVSLLDSDNSSGSLCVSSRKYDEQLRDLITFSGDTGASEVCSEILKEVERDGDRRGHIDDLMLANITNFAEDACKSSALEGPFLGVSTVVKRR